MTQDLKKKYSEIEQYVKVNVYDSGKIMSNFDEKLQKSAQKILHKRNNVNLFEETGVLKIERDRVLLSDGSVLPCSIIVWTAGLKPNYLIKSIESDENCQISVSKKGFIEVDEFLRTSAEGVYSLGDCSVVVDQPYQQAATVAEQQGIYLAKTVLNKKGVKNKFVFGNPGQLANLGGFSGLTELKKSNLVPIAAKFSGVYTENIGLMSEGKWLNVLLVK